MAIVSAATPALAADGPFIEIRAQNQADVQQALAQISPSGGTVVLLASDGPIPINESIVIDCDNVTLEGRGIVELRLADGANKPVIIVGQARAVPAVTRTNVHLRNLIINGNRSNQSSEFDLASPELRNNGISLRRVENCSVERVTTFACRSGGLVTELGCRDIRISDFEAYDNEFDGLACYQTEDSLFTSLNLHNNQAAGVSLDIGFVRNTIRDSLLANNRSVGIFVRDSRDNTFANLQISDSAQYGIFLAQVDQDTRTPAIGNKFEGCVITNSGGAGIRVNDASCVNNFLSTSKFLNNIGGPFAEVVPGLLKLGDMAPN